MSLPEEAQLTYHRFACKLFSDICKFIVLELIPVEVWYFCVILLPIQTSIFNISSI